FIIPSQSDTFRIGGVLPAPIAAAVTIPPIEAALMDRRLLAADLELLYPLYTGGRRAAVVDQARAGMTAAQQAARRADLEVVLDTRRYYWGAILARRLLRLAEDTLARLEVTLALTRSLYENGTGKVTRTDYLEHKVVVESLRGAVARLRASEELGRAAVAFSAGLPWQTELALVEEEPPFEPVHLDLAALAEATCRFNPDWAQLEAALDATEAQVRQEGGAGRPAVAAFGRLEYLANSYDAGLVGPEDKRSWVVGVALDWSLFTGFRTRHAVRAARARLAALQGQQILLREGLALQVRHLTIELTRTTQQEASAGAALEAARENRDLSTRAYQAGLVEVEDMVRSQIVEALAGAQYEVVRFEHAVAQAQLDFVVGGELRRVLGEGGS
ncbi:MAG: TolC family protein, partial [Gemmatimonadota bacterium]